MKVAASEESLTTQKKAAGAKVIDFPSAPAMVEIGSAVADAHAVRHLCRRSTQPCRRPAGRVFRHSTACRPNHWYAPPIPWPAFPRPSASRPIHCAGQRELEDALTRYAKAAQAIPFEDRTVIARAIGAIDGMVGVIAGRRMPGQDEALEPHWHALVPPEPETETEPVADSDIPRSPRRTAFGPRDRRARRRARRPVATARRSGATPDVATDADLPA